MSTYRISQLAECAGVPATTLRYYEREGLLTAARAPSGYRHYTDSDRERLRFITAAKHLGLALNEIRELLTVWSSGSCRDVRDDLGSRVAARVTAADERLADVQIFRNRLVVALEHLRELPARDEPCDRTCSFPTDRARETSVSSSTPSATGGTAELPSVVIGCSLGAGAYQQRRNEWARLLDAAAVSALPDGGRVARLPADRAGELARLVVAEQRCCPFFSFRIDFTGETVELVAHSADGADALMIGLFDRISADAASCPC